jgi:hypothetical protein
MDVVQLIGSPDHRFATHIVNAVCTAIRFSVWLREYMLTDLRSCVYSELSRDTQYVRLLREFLLETNALNLTNRMADALCSSQPIERKLLFFAVYVLSTKQFKTLSGKRAVIDTVTKAL